MTTPVPFPNRLAWYTGVLFVAATAAMVFLAIREGLPPAAAIVSFSLIVVFSAHRRVSFPNGVSVSPAFMVGIAAIVVFMHSHSLAGCILVGMLSMLCLVVVFGVHSGAEVLGVSSAADAFLAVDRETPAVVVSDIGLPVQDRSP